MARNGSTHSSFIAGVGGVCRLAHHGGFGVKALTALHIHIPAAYPHQDSWHKASSRNMSTIAGLVVMVEQP